MDLDNTILALTDQLSAPPIIDEQLLDSECLQFFCIDIDTHLALAVHRCLHHPRLHLNGGWS
jgi:hypothetical protein